MSLIIKTKRIELKKFSKNDINLLFELDGDSDVMKYLTLGKSKTIDEVKKESMPRILKSYTNGINYGIFPAYLKCNNTYIGWFQFEKDKHIENAIEVGWRLKKEHWGNGYATEASKKLFEHAFQKLNLYKISLGVSELNISALSLYNSLGFKKEGILVPAEDVTALSAAMIRLIDDPILRRRLGKNGRMRVAEFDWSHISARIADYYQNLLLKKSDTPINGE